MTIWELGVNEDYSNAFLNGEDGRQMFENGLFFLEHRPDPHTRLIRLAVSKKGFSDIMNYWGTSGSCIVSAKAKAVIEKYFGHLAIQFFSCYNGDFPDLEMWILSVTEYHDVLDIPNCVYRTMKNLKGEEVVGNIRKYAFKKEAFGLDMFKVYRNGYKNGIWLYVSDHFKQVMEENGITGLVLKEVYTI